MPYRYLPLFTMLVVLSVPASADIVFSNFGPGNSYNPNQGWTVEGSTIFQGPIVSAMGFNPSGNFTLTQIDVGIGHIFGTDPLLSLNSDSGGLPGAVVESWNLTGLPQFGSTSNTVQTVMPVSLVSLVSGTQYWLVASPGASDTEGAWNWNSTGSTGPFAQIESGGVFLNPNGLGGAFDILGNPTAVPEPTSLVLLATGLGLVGVALRRYLHNL